MLVFDGSMSFVDLPVKRGFDSTPLSHFSRTHYSTIPLFQHSNCERSELTCVNQVMRQFCFSIKILFEKEAQNDN